jgi:2-phosphosulfolactate phosphatase
MPNPKNGVLFFHKKFYHKPSHLYYSINYFCALFFMSQLKPSLHTCLSPALLHLYGVNHAVVVIIDVLRATSTIATALFNGARCVVPVDNIPRCIELGKAIDSITAGERDGQIAEGLQHGNSPFEYPREFVAGKTLVLTTTNGTKLLHMALEMGASHIVTGSFPNLSAVCDYIISKKQSVILACAAWKDRINLEDTLFAGAVVSKVRDHFSIDCDSSQIAETLYNQAKPDFFGFLKQKEASHYCRLLGYGLETDLRYCLTSDVANILPFYENGKLSIHGSTPDLSASNH